MKQIVILAGMLLSLSSTAWAQTRVAFVAGVERYNKSGLKDLEYAEDDAREVKYALEDLGFTTTSVIGQDASLDKLNKSLDEFIAATKRLNNPILQSSTFRVTEYRNLFSKKQQMEGPSRLKNHSSALTMPSSPMPKPCYL
jgi:hypothetical protein